MTQLPRFSRPVERASAARCHAGVVLLVGLGMAQDRATAQRVASSILQATLDAQA